MAADEINMNGSEARRIRSQAQAQREKAERLLAEARFASEVRLARIAAEAAARESSRKSTTTTKENTR